MLNTLGRAPETEVSSTFEATHSLSIIRIDQFSTTADMTNKPGLTERLANILFGKKHFRLAQPVGVLADNPDMLCVTDQLAGIILIDRSRGKFELPKADKYEVLPSPVGICRGHNDAIFITDSKLEKVFKLEGDSNKRKILGDGILLSRPTGILYESMKRQAWVVETGAHRISVLDSAGNRVKVLGSRGTGPGEFNFPTFICAGADGTIYIVDSMNFRVQLFSNDGEFIGMFGEGGDATGYLARPKGIATDSYGHIYLVDGLFHAVQVFDKEGNFLYTFGSQGNGDGEFWLPVGIHIDDHDRIYVADSYNSRIQIFQLISNAADKN